MDIVDLRGAVDSGDLNYVREMFRAFVDPNEDVVRANDPSLVAAAYDLVMETLKDDSAIMPRGICAALDLEDGATYAQGAAVANMTGQREALSYLLPRDGGSN